MIKSFNAWLDDNEPKLQEIADETGKTLDDVARKLYEMYEQSAIDVEY